MSRRGNDSASPRPVLIHVRPESFTRGAEDGAPGRARRVVRAGRAGEVRDVRAAMPACESGLAGVVTRRRDLPDALLQAHQAGTSRRRIADALGVSRRRTPSGQLGDGQQDDRVLHRLETVSGVGNDQ